MKLTIDASIVVKWFVAEPLSDAARRLLSHRIGPLTDLWRRLTRVWAAMGHRRGSSAQSLPAKLAKLPERTCAANRLLFHGLLAALAAAGRPRPW